MLLHFYGTECPHCDNMKPLIEQLKRETGVFIDSRETWHNEENAKMLAKYDKGFCGGVPFFYNPENGKHICGEATIEELRDWAGKQ
jgi:thiol-disulfide isomerase/thioredoxin